MPRTLLLLALAACSSSSSTAGDGTATVSGTVGGTAFAPKDAIFAMNTAGTSAQIVLTSTPDICADIMDNVQRANARVLLIEINDATKLAAGTYMTSYATPIPPHNAIFESNVTDAQCHVSYDPPPDGTGDGTITLTTLTSTTASGTFDVMLENAEHVTGTFHPSSCPELLTRGGMPTCAP